MKLFDTHGQEIDFDIPDSIKKVGVNCSGGADSSILLYMTCEYLKSQNRTDTAVSVITCGNDLKHRWNPRKAANVINFIVEDLEYNPFDMHYAYYRDRQDKVYFHKVEKDLFTDGRIEWLLSGITANPRVPAFVENSRGVLVDLSVEALPDRNVENYPVYGETEWGGKFYTPFVNVDKRFVAAMYSQYKVPALFDLTRSCEAIPDQIESFDPDFENQPCGNCWWCLERKWAFGRL